MYRPTVRYADEYKTYVDALFHATTLDRNQILRAALFSAAYSREFQHILSSFKKGDVPTPSPTWRLDDWRWWKYQEVKIEEEGKDVNAYDSGKGSYEENGTISNVRRGFDQKRNEALQQESFQRKTERRNGAVAAKQSRDVIRGNGGGITIRIN